MDIPAILQWIAENWDEVCEGIAAIIGLASFIVRITPTLKDDNWLLPIIKFIGKYIALNRSGDDEIRASRR